MSAQATVAVVFDCVVFVQAAASNTGASFACLELLEAGTIKLFVSDGVLAEVRDVLSRPALRRKRPHLTDKRVQDLMERLERYATHLPDRPGQFPYARDPKDEKYLDLAVMAPARYLVSRDKDLLDLMQEDNPEGVRFRKQFPNITILDPGAFLRAIRERDEGH